MSVRKSNWWGMSDTWQAFQKALNTDPALQAQLKAA
jgi:hypothetical protein